MGRTFPAADGHVHHRQRVEPRPWRSSTEKRQLGHPRHHHEPMDRGRLSRAATMTIGSTITIAVLHGRDTCRSTACGVVTRSEELGRAITAKDSGAAAAGLAEEFFLGFTAATSCSRGRSLRRVARDARRAFNFNRWCSTASARTRDHQAFVEFQNENLSCVVDGDQATVPDLISFLLTLTRSRLHHRRASKYGKRVLGRGPRSASTWRTPAGSTDLGPRYFGITIHDYIPVEEQFCARGRGVSQAKLGIDVGVDEHRRRPDRRELRRWWPREEPHLGRHLHGHHGRGGRRARRERRRSRAHRAAMLGTTCAHERHRGT